MKPNEEIMEFLKENPTFYLATVDGYLPRVRPIGFAMWYNGHLCIALGKHKAAYKQLLDNTNLEICAANDRGEWLMMRRNGRWDLPKGHLECGERIEACAVREIVEETGVCAEPVRPLCRTWHAYYFPKTERWELKRTHWYELRAVACGDLVPQTEEGIETVVWCTPAEAMAHAAGSFPTVRAVLERLEACLSDDKKR